ncbi:unnamed protein product [Blepharisma stoltei]|uniref:Uncharacterized protein n=1 Tax=Blepharisma stoltei TaxID=1481888 RepID=A0AAU9I4G0_9CILI|nr:unnamed protein product [Blepharisma stoltei]
MVERNKQNAKASENLVLSERSSGQSLIPPETSNYFSLLRVSDPPMENLKLSNPESIENLREEIIESINQIYNEYLNNYISCKSKRMWSKNPLEKRRSYNLYVDKAFRRQLQEELKQLIHSEGTQELRDSLCGSAHTFVDSLNDQLIELMGRSKMLRAICLAEAYHTLQNSSKEIEKIVSCLFKEPTTFENLNKIFFYERIVKNSVPLIEYVKNQDQNHFVVPLIEKMERESKCAVSVLTSAPLCDILSDDSFSNHEGSARQSHRIICHLMSLLIL